MCASGNSRLNSRNAGSSHHRVANPVGASYYDALNASYLEFVHGLAIRKIYHLPFGNSHFGFQSDLPA